MLGQLSVPVPKVDFDRHVAKQESRLRPLRSDEPIELKKLDDQLHKLPTFADPANPSKSEAEAIADAHFKNLTWTQSERSEEIEVASVSAANDAVAVDVPNVVVALQRAPSRSNKSRFDLSSIDA